MFAGGRWRPVMVFLVVAALAAFLLRQPASMMVKSLSGRRSKGDLPAAILWVCLYAGIALVNVVVLDSHGFGYLLYLAVPGLLVFAWHLYLVSRRAERYRMGVDIVASGTLALAAPGAYWVGIGEYSTVGWWLWALCWLQSAASIVYAFLRLTQRKLEVTPSLSGKLKMARRALLYGGFNFLLVLVLAQMKLVSAQLWIPYTLQFVETLWGTFRPALGVKPTQIGLRQLVVSCTFTALFILCW